MTARHEGGSCDTALWKADSDAMGVSVVGLLAAMMISGGRLLCSCEKRRVWISCSQSFSRCLGCVSGGNECETEDWSPGQQI